MYKKHLQSTSRNTAAQQLTGTLTFISKTSQLVQIFTDNRPFSSLDDERFLIMRETLDWFEKWRKDIESLPYSPQQRKKMFISTKCYFDVSSMILGFRRLCELSFALNPGCAVRASKTNSDIVENIFCQQRAANGSSDNPTAAQYG